MPNSHAHHADFGQVPKTFCKVEKSIKSAFFKKNIWKKQVFIFFYTSTMYHGYKIDVIKISSSSEI